VHLSGVSLPSHPSPSFFFLHSSAESGRVFPFRHLVDPRRPRACCSWHEKRSANLPNTPSMLLCRLDKLLNDHRDAPCEVPAIPCKPLSLPVLLLVPFPMVSPLVLFTLSRAGSNEGTLNAFRPGRPFSSLRDGGSLDSCFLRPFSPSLALKKEPRAHAFTSSEAPEVPTDLPKYFSLFQQPRSCVHPGTAAARFLSCDCARFPSHRGCTLSCNYSPPLLPIRSLSALKSALLQNTFIAPLESALPKKLGWGGSE
jgi:hypothetical protein